VGAQSNNKKHNKNGREREKEMALLRKEMDFDHWPFAQEKCTKIKE
jgi:hypothetical protein